MGRGASNEETFEELKALEVKLHQQNTRSSIRELDSLLSDDFREIGASGVYFGKAEVLGGLPSEDFADIRASRFEFRVLSQNVVHITYVSRRYNEEGELLRVSYRTSIWQYQDERWQMVFHQGTVATDVE